jgi:stage II sporulation protein GA (sporulation sigma-E factor processing peptidase)
MDLIILIIVKNIIKYPTTKVRLCLGAAIGALCACILSVFQGLNALIQFLFVYIFVSYFMIAITFKKQKIKARIKGVILLYITTFFLGGVMNSLYYYTKLGYYFTEILNGRFNMDLFHNRKVPFIILAIIFIILSVIIFMAVFKYGRTDLGLYQIELVYSGKTTKIVGFLDTGNLLYDPIFRKPVMITDFLAIAPLLSNNQIRQVRAVLDSFDDNNEISAAVSDHLQESPDELEPVNIMMIPYRSVGKKHGMLPALILDELTIWNGDEKTNRKRVYTAISGNVLNGQREYQAILHKEIM